MKLGIRPVMTAEFNAWAYTKEEAHKKIAYRLALMQEMFTECALLAQANDIKLSFELELPSKAKGGHNSDTWVHWNPSSQHC